MCRVSFYSVPVPDRKKCGEWIRFSKNKLTVSLDCAATLWNRIPCTTVSLRTSSLKELALLNPFQPTGRRHQNEDFKIRIWFWVDIKVVTWMHESWPQIHCSWLICKLMSVVLIMVDALQKPLLLLLLLSHIQVSLLAWGIPATFFFGGFPWDSLLMLRICDWVEGKNYWGLSVFVFQWK